MKSSSGILHITSKVDYGVFFLSNLAENSEGLPVSLKQFAEGFGMSFPFLQKVARSLKQAGIIDAKRGKDGGYVLSKEPKNISLKDIIEALEGPIKIARCLRGESCQRNSICRVKNHLAEINLDIEKLFKSKTLKDFI